MASNILNSHKASDSERIIRVVGETLAPTVKELVEFDPENEEHLLAYAMLAHEGKQHPDLRFICPEQYPSVLDMMRIRLADTKAKQQIFEITGNFPKYGVQQ